MKQKDEIRVFLASSNELEDERIKISDVIRQKNDIWRKQQKPYINLEVWEECSEAMARVRNQDEYNKIIKTVDIFIMLFWTKVGKYTNEEFQLAKKLFLEIGMPKVFVYQKHTADPKEESVRKFSDSLLTEGKEFFIGNFKHFSELELKIHKELESFYFESFQHKPNNTMSEKNDFNTIIDNDLLPDVFEYLDAYYEDMGSHKPMYNTIKRDFESDKFGMLEQSIRGRLKVLARKFLPKQNTKSTQNANDSSIEQHGNKNVAVGKNNGTMKFSIN